jgi:uncharacterized protein DUF6335
MAKRKAVTAKRKAKSARGPAATRRQRTGARRSAKRPTGKKRAAKKAIARKTKPAARKTAKPAVARTSRASAKPAAKVPRLDRARRTLDGDIVQTPPSSLDMNRRGTAARTGRAEMAESVREHHGMNDVAGGDVDVDVEDAFFTGEEAPGGDNPTPDQDLVDDIGKALGVEYADNEELKAADKVGKRDKHRWELDPASSEDYKERE